MTRFRPNPRTRSSPRTYGVLVGTVKDGTIDSNRSPHYEIWVQANDVNYRIAVNVLSDDGSEVMAYFDPNYDSSLLQKHNLEELASSPGFTPLKTGPEGETGPEGVGIDYLRDNLFPVHQMREIPPEGAGVTLQNLLDGQIERAKADSKAVVIAFGEFFKDDGSDDDTFGFSPERGIHDIHMMQGNRRGHHDNDNRVNGDGALFLRFPSGKTVALFVRFMSQAVDTNNSTGGRIEV